jgi:hypothetical protein
MLRFLADENFNNRILKGLHARSTELDIVRVQDVGLGGSDDPVVLAWAAEAGRVLITHDVSTVTRFAHQRVQAAQPMPGIVEVCESIPIGQAIEDLLLLANCCREGECEGLVLYLPF